MAKIHNSKYGTTLDTSIHMDNTYIFMLDQNIGCKKRVEKLFGKQLIN